MSRTIAIEELRIGMYVHLEGGWLSHPFPLSNFRIASEDQLDTLRGLGLQSVRWSPERSDPSVVDGGTDAPQVAARAADAPATITPEQRHRQALHAQRETQRQCEEQFGEAAGAWRKAIDSVAASPEQTRLAVEAMSQVMLDKIQTGGDLGIRLVNGGGTDRAAAHAMNVTVVAMLIGRTLGLPQEELQDLAVGAMMHDIGKLEIAERMRHLDSGCTPAEVAAYREHVLRGVAAGKRMGLSAGALTVIAQHHEYADASGFPQRISGDRMSIASRIVAIVDRYDVLCNPATRVPALTPHEAVATLFAQGRALYDPAVLNTFIRMMGVYPAGSLVQLTDDRYAKVIGVNSSRPLKPRVLVHDPKVPRHEALLVNLELEPDIGIRRSLTAGKLPSAALDYLDPKPRVGYYFESLAEVAALREAEAA